MHEDEELAAIRAKLKARLMAELKVQAPSSDGIVARNETDEELEGFLRAHRGEILRDRAPSATVAGGAGAADADAAVVDVTDADVGRFLRENENVVIDCWAPWCGPCRIVAPIVEQLAVEMKGRVRFAKLNTDTNPRTATEFRIQSIPTLLVFRQGRVLDTIVGAHPKPRLAATIERAFGRRTSGAAGPRRM